MGAIEIDALSVHLGACSAPLLQSNLIAKIDANRLQDRHRSVVDAKDLLLAQRLKIRQPSRQLRQHRVVASRSERPSGFASAAAGLCRHHAHEVLQSCDYETPFSHRVRRIGLWAKRRHAPYRKRLTTALIRNRKGP